MIPDSVTTIGDYAFYNCDGFTSLKLGNSVETIGSSAFRSCNGFTGSLVIPDSVTTIGSYAFYSNSINEYRFEGDAPSISSYSFDGGDLIVYPFGNESWVLTDGKWNGYKTAMYDPEDPDTILMGYCGGTENPTDVLWKLNKNGTLTITGEGPMADYINNGSYYSPYVNTPWYNYRTQITHLVIEEGVTGIGDYAFYNCSALTGNLDISDSVTTIGDYAFYYCSGLTGNLDIPDNVTTIGDYAFYYCSGFTGSLDIQDVVTEIGDYVFYYCYGFTGNLVIPDSVTSIGSDAFYNCDGFTSLELGSNVETIGSYAFQSCNGFTGNLDIPDSVTTIGNAAFNNCNGFTSLKIGNNVKTIGSSAFSTGSYSDNYDNYEGELVIPDSVISIGDYAFENCDGFTSLKLGKNVQTIGTEAFYDCNGFTGNLVIPDSVTTIGDRAFCSCYGFTGNLDIPDSVTTIGNSAFQSCNGFTGSLVIPEGVTTIYGNAFYSTGFSSISVPSTVTSIGNYAFRSSYLKEITISENNQSYCIENGALLSKDKKTFYEVIISSATEYEIPEGVEVISANAFNGISFNAVIVPESVKTVKEDAFYGYDNDVVFMGQPENIEKEAFYCYWSNDKINVYFMNGAPINCADNAFYTYYSSESIKLYYLKGTESKWTFDSEGIYKGKTIAPFELNGTAEFDPSKYIASGYCGKDILGGKNLAWMLDSNGVLVIKGKGPMMDYSDEYMEDFGWCSDAPWAKYRDSIKSVVFEEGITYIGKNAFYQLGIEIDGFVIPEGVTAIGEYAFEGNSHKSVTIPSTLDISLMTDYSFGNSYQFEEYIVAEENPYLYDVDGVLFSKDKKTLFAFPAGRTGSYEIPSGTETIESDAFEDNNLDDIVVSETVKTINRSAIYGYSGNVIFMGQPETIGQNAIYAYDGNMPVSVYFMNGMPVSAENYAFGSNAELYYLSGTEDKWTFDENGLWNGYEVKPYSAEEDVKIDFSKYAAGGYCGAGPLGGKNIAWMLDSSGVLTIKGSGKMKDYEQVYVENGDGSGNWVYTSPLYEHRTKVKSIVFEGNIESIGTLFFRGFNSYNYDLELPKSLKYIGEEAFNSFRGSGDLVIPEGVTYVGLGAFMGARFDSIRVPSTMVNSNYAMDWVYVQNIYVSENNPQYCDVDGVFATKDKTTLISFPRARTGEYTVDKCFTEIGDNAFENSSLTNVTIPETVKYIRSRAFDEFSGTVVINGRPEELGYRAFSARDNDLSVYFMAGEPESIDEEPFYNYGRGAALDLYYLKGTEDEWTFDENGLWNGYEIKPFESSPAVEFDPKDYVASGYCGAEPNGGKNIAWMIEDEGVLTIKGSGNMASFTEIQLSNGNWGTSAPWYEQNITKVVIEDGIESIGGNAFYRMFEISGIITIPESVKSVGSYAFRGPQAGIIVNGTLENVGNMAFYPWNSNQSISVYFMNGAPVSLGDRAFGNQINYNALIYYLSGTEDKWSFDQNGKWNGYTVNAYTPGKTEDLDLTGYIDGGYCGADPVTEGKNMVWLLDSNGVITIKGSGNMADFVGISTYGGGYQSTSAPWSIYSNSVKKVVIEEGVEGIGNMAFYMFYSVKEISISSSLKRIGYSAFSNCGISGDFVIPEGVEYIGISAFNWNQFTSVTLPASLTELGNYAFSGPKFERYYVSGNSKTFCAVESALYSKDKKTLVAVPDAFGEKYSVPEGTEIVEAYVFSGSYVTSVEIPESVKLLKEYSFNGFTGTVVINGNPEIESWAFRAFFGDTVSVYFMNGEPCKIYQNSFNEQSGKINLYYLYGTENKWTFDENGLWNGYTVKHYSPAEEVKFDPDKYVASGYCGNDPFIDGKNLAWMLDSNGVLTIKGKGAMAEYTEVQYEGRWMTSAPWNRYYAQAKSLVIEDGVTNIGAFAFYGMTEFTGDLTICGSVKQIGSYVFINSGFDGNIVLEEGIESLGYRAFTGTNAKNVYLPSTLKEINEAFEYGSATGLENIFVSENSPYYSSVDGMLCSKDGKTLIQFPLGRTGEYTIPDGIETIGTYAFWNAETEVIIVPESVRVLEAASFYNVEGTVIIMGQLDSIGGSAFRAFNTMKVKVIFMNGEPKKVGPSYEMGYGPFAEQSGGTIDVYYLKGTESKWTFDENGLWNGYEIKEYEPGRILGDINGDTIVNVKDAYVARLIAAKIEKASDAQKYSGDVDGDGKITAIDANYIRRYSVNMISEFPAE